MEYSPILSPPIIPEIMLAKWMHVFSIVDDFR